MDSDLYFNGKKYISVKRGSRITGYSPDYIGQLCRGGKLESRLIGKTRYVSVTSLNAYVSSLNLASKTYVKGGSKSNDSWGTKLRSNFSQSLSQKIKAPFYSHYPKVLSYMTEGSKSHRSVVYEQILKRALLGSFVFIFFFDLTSTYGQNILEGSVKASRGFAITTTQTLVDFEGYVGGAVAEGYVALEKTLRDTTTSQPKELPFLENLSAVGFSQHLQEWNENPFQGNAFAISGDVVFPTVAENISRDTFGEKKIRQDSFEFVAAAKSVRETVNQLSREYDKASVEIARGVYRALDDVSDLYAYEFMQKSISSSEALLDFSRNFLDSFVQGEQNIGDLAAAGVTQVANTGNLLDRAGSFVYGTLHSWFTPDSIPTMPFVGPSIGSVAVPVPVASSTPVVTKPTVVQKIVQVPQTPQTVQYIQNIQQTTGGITSSEFESRIATLENSISARFNGLSSGGGGSITNVYQQIASSQRIDNLSGTRITNPTITGGSFTGGSVSDANIAATTLSVSDTGTSTFAGGH